MQFREGTFSPLWASFKKAGIGGITGAGSGSGVSALLEVAPSA